MRTNFIQALTSLAEEDKRIFLLVGDLGYSVVEDYIKKFPERYVNVGVAEQNMMGIAAGLALCGNIVFTYTFANFTTFRCLEQIRNDICYHNADVKIVSIGSGFSYGYLGTTHHGVEDVAIMAALPNMAVIVPCDPVETALAIKASINWKGPCYIGVRRTGEKNMHKSPPDFEIGKAITIKDGTDVTLIATGWIMNNTMKAADLLAKDGFKARVISMHTIKPLDTEMVIRCAQETGSIVTIEDHIRAGLGSAVAMALASSPQRATPFMSLGLKEEYSYGVGSEEYHLNKANLSPEGIYRSVALLLRDENKI